MPLVVAKYHVCLFQQLRPIYVIIVKSIVKKELFMLWMYTKTFQLRQGATSSVQNVEKGLWCTVSEDSVLIIHKLCKESRKNYHIRVAHSLSQSLFN